MSPLRRLAVSAVLLCLALPALAQSPESIRDDYTRLQGWRFRAAPVEVPPGGARWSFGGATWSFESGRFWLQEPTSGGAVTGVVFEGKGRFRMEVPDPIELTQLRRFARKPDLAALDEPFTAMVLRSSGELPVQAEPTAGGYEVHRLARDRHEHWLTQRIFDADARVVAALHAPGDLYVRTDVRTAGFDWLTYEYDARRLEEIRLESFNTTYPYAEVWLALDRPEERDPRGRPASAWRPEVDVEHVDVAVDLTRAGRDKDSVAGQFRTGVRFQPREAGARAVQLYLHPYAKVTAVSEGGKPLPFLRDHVGGRKSSLENRLYDGSLVVLLDRPLERGEARRLDVEYELELGDYAPGRAWYPGTEGDETILRDAHTARLEVTSRKRHEVRTMGRREDGEGGEEEKRTTTVWTVDEPVKMLTFSFAERFHEEKVQGEGVPEVICFGSKNAVGGKTRFRNVGADVANSMSFFQQLLGAPLPPRPLYVTSIAAYHGQSFDGFIHMSEGSFNVEEPGATELFRAHEVAHQWWGHMVGSATYRDVWLGEAFAEYSAMMFVESTVQGGSKLFDEIIRVYNHELNGSIQGGFSKFARPGIGLLNKAYGDRIGPIGHGWRSNTGEVPTAYSSQVYRKGPLVLHMLRGLLRDMTRGDDVFVEVLRDFVRTHRGGFASTRDFQAVLARHARADWSWFFDQWVDGTAIPSYRWSYEIATSPDAQGRYIASLRVRQSDVPPGFKMSVPVVAELPGGKVGRVRVMVDEPDETFPIPFPEKPRSLTFNPGFEVLAKTKRD